MSVQKDELTAEKLLKRPLSFELLEKVGEPKNIWKYFLLLTEHPRKSGNLGHISQVLLDLAPKLGVQADLDGIGNIRFRKAAKPGYEDAPGVCIQAHIDMVTSANSDTPIDFDKDPITPRIDGNWLKATGTTLGADDGLGVAAALAILEDDQLNHGMIEALFTVDEETTMIGGEQLGPAPFLQSDILLNVDSEEENGICIGCAGGQEDTLRFNLSRENAKNDGEKYYKVFLYGLLGGHSGVDIALGRANAIKVLNTILRAGITENENIKIVEFFGGNQPNVIPRECYAVLSIPTDSFAAFEASTLRTFERVKEDYLSVEHVKSADGNENAEKRVSNMMLKIDEVSFDEFPFNPFDRASTLKIEDAIEIFPHGVIRMNYDVSGLVDTSNNLSHAKSFRDDEKNIFEIHTFARSSSTHALVDFYDKMVSIGRTTGANVNGRLNEFPGWEPNVTALALKVMKTAFTELRPDITPHVYAIHAGLECGLIKAVYPDISCVSIGPEIQNAHSPDEAALIPSVDRFYKLAHRFIELIAQEKKSAL